jgi:hypothetical protein
MLRSHSPQRYHDGTAMHAERNGPLVRIGHFIARWTRFCTKRSPIRPVTIIASRNPTLGRWRVKTWRAAPSPLSPWSEFPIFTAVRHSRDGRPEGNRLGGGWISDQTCFIRPTRAAYCRRAAIRSADPIRGCDCHDLRDGRMGKVKMECHLRRGDYRDPRHETALHWTTRRAAHPSSSEFSIQP